MPPTEGTNAMHLRLVLVCSLLVPMPSCVEDGGDDAAMDTSGGQALFGAALYESLLAHDPQVETIVTEEAVFVATCSKPV